MELLTGIFITPFAEMIGLPDLFFQALWDGFVSGTPRFDSSWICFNI